MAILLNTRGYETQLVVFEAFERLLQSNDFDNISVSMICKEAGVSRSTFYYHFKDKFDISRWYYGLVAETYLFQTGRTLSWLQANFLTTLEFAKHETVYRECFDMNGYESLFEHAKRRRIETLRETIVVHKREKLDAELEFQVVALADAEVGGVTHWFKGGMPYSVMELCLYLDTIVPRRLYDLLNDPIDETLQPLLGNLQTVQK